MEACEVDRFFVNKAIVPTASKRHGNPGYGSVKAMFLVKPMVHRLPVQTAQR
jgi:hypothetical protein